MKRIAAAAAAAAGHVSCNSRHPALAPPPGGDWFFSEQRLAAAFGKEKLARPEGVEVMSYHYPAWHPSAWMEQRLGQGWTEYKTLREAKTLFPGHAMPRKPLLGEFDESSPEWAQREIDLAVSHGVTGWMIDWYWHSGTMFFHEQLENGFLKAPRNSSLKFAVMWANHDWKDYFPAASPEAAPVLIAQHHSAGDCVRAIRYAIDRYFHAPNYWRLGGEPVFGIYDLPGMLKQLGKDGARRTFDLMREETRKAGFSDLHLQWSQSGGSLVRDLANLGFKSATQYHPFGWTYGGRPAGGRTHYGEACGISIAKWFTTRDKSSVVFFPGCAVGWDDSPRFGARSHIVTGRTPDQFERLCRGARDFVSTQETKVVFLSSWNEWTEDHVLLPDAEFGYGYLESVKRALAGPGRT